MKRLALSGLGKEQIALLAAAVWLCRALGTCMASVEMITAGLDRWDRRNVPHLLTSLDNRDLARVLKLGFNRHSLRFVKPTKLGQRVVDDLGLLLELPEMVAGLKARLGVDWRADALYAFMVPEAELVPMVLPEPQVTKFDTWSEADIRGVVDQVRVMLALEEVLR